MRLSPPVSLDPPDYQFVHRVQPRFAETDAMGIVHHGSYLLYLEEARVAWLDALGRPYQQVRDDGVDITVLEVFTQYRRPVRFGESVEIHVALGPRTRTTCQIDYLLTVDDELRLVAATMHGFVNRDGRPQRMPAWLAP